MKHKIILLTIIILFGFQTFAQQKPFRFGMKVAPNIAWISSDTEDYENDGTVVGFSWGFLADITLMEHYFLKTGFNFDYLNCKLKLPYDSISQELTGGSLFRKYNFRYLEIPLTMKMRTNQFGKFAFYGNIGFGASFRIKAKSKDEFVNEMDSSRHNEENDIMDEITLFRGSLIVGAGIEYFIDQSTSLVIDITYNNGLSNIFKGDNSVNDLKQKGHLNFVQFNVGIMF